ncbi:DUF3810 domain-containing protein [Clostridium prolinivorans]|uniref:DUF3810 domain-containing protein n=1 Tax=Clostridium prolinivorans TaxID=2769420 RepID=UPI000FD7EE5D|nr:DUF3810 domain-containing protein [Clostridium prolinivorans]
MKNKTKFIIIILASITFLINIILKKFPYIIEKYYSLFINKITIQVISSITGLVPFSIAEFLIIILAVILIILFVLVLFSFKTNRFLQNFINLCTYISVLYILFMFLWGFNYNRLSFDKIAGLDIKKSSTKDLYDLCENLINRANILSKEVNRDSKGIVNINYKDAFIRAQKGYEKAGEIYPELSYKYGIPKKILFSKLMSYTGITGIYIPYTCEANVNVNITEFTIPSTVAHEMAHQRGFAREDEANYIAYLTCTMHPDKDFQYSGIMLALVYSMNELYKNDIEGFNVLKAKYSDLVKKDLIYDKKFWEKYEGKAQKISNNINNTYLKSNGQKDGVQSYGRMVDLLIAENKQLFPKK